MSRPEPAGPPTPTLLSMSVPLIISFWMRAAVTFVDTIFAAMLGDASVAAIGLAIPFEFLMIALWVGLSTGLTSGLSRAMGARDSIRIRQYLRTTWRLVGVLGPLFTVVGVVIWFASDRVGLDPATARAFQIYGTVLIVGSAFTSFWSVIPDSLVKAHQDTRATMWAGVWTNLLNVGLNTLFLFVFHWGVFGIALSTVLARVGGLVYAVHRAGQHEKRRKAAWDEQAGHADPTPYRAILALAIPSSMSFVLMAGESAVVNGLLANMRHATEAIAAYSIYYRVVLFALQPVIATAVALLPYAAVRIGAGDYRGVRRGLNEALAGIVVYSVVLLGPLLWLLAPWIATQLSESEVTLRYTTFALRMVPLACLFGAPFLICRPVFEAMNRGRPGLIVALLRYLVLTAPLAWGGMVLATSIGYPPMYGLIVGTLFAGLVPSALFAFWLRGALDAAAYAHES
jgi:Na+-driven multidrug efflux pump